MNYILIGGRHIGKTYFLGRLKEMSNNKRSGKFYRKNEQEVMR